MANSIKYNNSSIESLSLRKGDFYLGVGDVTKGPTNVTGFWNGSDVLGAKYVIYLNKSEGGPSIYGPADDSSLITLTNKIAGANYTTVAECLAWFATQNDKVIVNKTYPYIVTDGLIFTVDAGFIPSFPTTGTTWYDLGGSPKNGTLTNGPTFNQNQGAIVFDGIDDRIILSSSVTLSGPFTWTIDCKSNLMSSSQNRQVYLGGSSSYFEQSDYDTFFMVYGSGNLNLELPIGLIPQNRWYNITVTRKSDNTFDFYYNGIKQILRSGGTTPVSDSFSLNTIGSIGGGGRYWNGSMSNVFVYNRLLSDSEISQNYYQAPVVTDGLVFMSDAANLVSFESGSTTTYSLVNNYTGTLTNGTTYSSNAGGVFVFDGTNDYIEMPYNSYWDSNVFGTATNFTISCWAKPNLFMNWDTLITKNIQGWYSSPEGASIWTDANGFQGVFSSGVLSNPAGSAVVISYATTNTEKWYHVCFTGDGTTLRLYVDGIQRATGLVASRTVPVTTAAVGPSFGRRDFWNGQMSNMMFYTRGITANEVWQNFNAQRSRFGI
jgi:hypothetical protein